jgi:hypothetical protein
MGGFNGRTDTEIRLEQISRVCKSNQEMERVERFACLVVLAKILLVNLFPFLSQMITLRARDSFRKTRGYITLSLYLSEPTQS